MMIWQITALGAFLAVLLASRVISEKASALLDESQRDLLAHSFSAFRKFTIFPLLGIIVAYYAGLKIFPAHEDGVSKISFMLLFVYVVAVNAIVLRKMNSLRLPPKYVRRIVLARALLYGAIGLVVLFLWITAGGLLSD